MWAAPGVLLCRWLLPRADALERAVVALGLGIVTVSPTTFLITVLGQSAMSPFTVICASLGWTLVGAALLGFRDRAPPPVGEPELPSAGVLLGIAVVVAAALAVFTLPYAMRATDTFWHCPHLSCLYLLEDGTGGGLSVWHPHWGRWATHLFVHSTDEGFGLGPVLAIQRAGNAAFLAQPFAMMSTGGLIVALWCADFLICGLAMLLARRHLRSRGLVALVAVLFLLGARALASYQVNENGIGLGLSMLALHLLLRRKGSHAAHSIAIGLVLGHLAGIRPATLLLIPAVLVLACHGARGRDRWRTAGWLLAAMALSTAPWLVTNALALGGPFEYPQLAAGKEAQSFLGLSFTFHPLNWPLADSLMRPPEHPFPTAIRLPLELLQAMGAPMLCAAALGLVALPGRAKRLGLWLWSIPIPLGLILIVSLDYQKLSYVLLSLAPVPLWVGAGLGELRASRSARAVLAVGLSFALVVLPRLIRDVQLDVDERAHIDHSWDARDGASETERREALTRASFLPYLSAELGARGAVGAELLWHARPAVRPAGEPLDEGLVTVWVPLGVDRGEGTAGRRRPAAKAGGTGGRPPGQKLPGPFQVRTSPQPRIPPDYIGSRGIPGAGPSSGRLLFVVELPSPAPERATVRLTPRGDSYTLAVVGDGKRTAGARWVTVLVVSRSSQVHGPAAIAVERRMEPVWTVTMWSQLPGGAGWRPQPRLVSNRPWSVAWGGERFQVHQGTPPPMAGTSGTDTECEVAGSGVSRACVGRDCTWTLTHQGRPTAIVVPSAPGARGSRLFAWGSGYPSRPASGAPCARQLLRMADGWLDPVRGSEGRRRR